MNATGILALWNDCAEGKLDTYEHWYRSEHLYERLGIPGFQIGRRYENPDISPRFFTYYETDAPDVLSSAPYQERLNDPTPLTREVMLYIFLNLSRTLCERVRVFGEGHGAHVVTAKLPRVPADDLVGQITDDPACIRLELWRAAGAPTPPQSAEERLRGGDTSINASLIAHTLRKEDAANLAGRLQSMFPDADISSYRFLCELRESEVPE